MKKFSSAKFLLLIILVFTAGSVKSQITTTTRFKLNGKHVFERKDVKSWTVSQELIDEKTGETITKENLITEKGEKVKFDLPKIKGKETIYHIVGEGENFTQKYTVRVFEPDKISSFLYKSEGNPAVRTYVFVPKSLSAETRILLVMHGLSRNADDYIASWETWAAKKDYIVIAPNFDEENWKGSAMYNLGNILTEKDSMENRSKWSFQVVEDIHISAKDGFDLKKNYFDMFGHSAGGQFVHRFALFMPESNLRLAIAANSGWYTVPDLEQKFPYGLKHARFSFTQADLMRWSKRYVYILRGVDDTERSDNLRQNAETDAQGQNRFERAGFMFDKIKSVNAETNWRLIDVPKVAHDQKKMAVAAQYVLDLINSQNK